MKNKNILAITFWDNILFNLHNLFQTIRYIYFLSRHKLTYLNRNKKLYKIHSGERCFILMNAPSLLDFDLSLLKNEKVICMNHFWASDKYEIVNPDYYVASDTHFFFKEYYEKENNYLDKIIDLTERSGAKCIFPSAYLNLRKLNNLEEHVFVTYSKHKPNYNFIKHNLASLSSNFGSVSLFAINAAIYMGFSEIYLLGYELPPWKNGLMPHAHKNTEEELITEKRLTSDENMFSQISLHWQYYQVQYENYLIARKAKKRNILIYNCTNNTYVKAFKHKDFNQLFS